MVERKSSMVGSTARQGARSRVLGPEPVLRGVRQRSAARRPLKYVRSNLKASRMKSCMVAYCTVMGPMAFASSFGTVLTVRRAECGTLTRTVFAYVIYELFCAPR